MCGLAKLWMNLHETNVIFMEAEQQMVAALLSDMRIWTNTELPGLLLR